jgi:hypothetical protein
LNLSRTHVTVPQGTKAAGTCCILSNFHTIL